MQIILRTFGTVIVLISMLRVTLGAGADRLLDPSIDPAAVVQPSVDSQARFYGGMFALSGVLLWLGATDIDRYRPVLTTVFVVFFGAGMARAPAALRYGLPALPVALLTALELATPPLLLWWLHATPS